MPAKRRRILTNRALLASRSYFHEGILALPLSRGGSPLYSPGLVLLWCCPAQSRPDQTRARRRICSMPKSFQHTGFWYHFILILLLLGAVVFVVEGLTQLLSRWLPEKREQAGMAQAQP